MVGGSLPGFTHRWFAGTEGMEKKHGNGNHYVLSGIRYPAGPHIQLLG